MQFRLAPGNIRTNQISCPAPGCRYTCIISLWLSKLSFVAFTNPDFVQFAESFGTRGYMTVAYFGGYTHAEFSEQLHILLGTVKGRMRLGLQKMKVFLAELGMDVMS